jgi:hypothetical protein
MFAGVHLMTPLLSAGCVLLAVSAAAAVLFLSEGVAADPFWGADPAWSLIHEPAVEQELKLSSAKSRELRSRSLLDGLDARFFPLRNRPPEEAAKGVPAGPRRPRHLSSVTR